MKPRKTRNDTENHDLFPCHSVSSVVINFCLSRMWLLSLPCLLGFVFESSVDAQTFASVPLALPVLGRSVRLNSEGTGKASGTHF